MTHMKSKSGRLKAAHQDGDEGTLEPKALGQGEALDVEALAVDGEDRLPRLGVRRITRAHA